MYALHPFQAACYLLGFIAAPQVDRQRYAVLLQKRMSLSEIPAGQSPRRNLPYLTTVPSIAATRQDREH
jgi:hypothetical protein